MYPMAVYRVRGFEHTLSESRMRVYRASQLLDGRFKLDRRARFGDEISGVRPDNMNTENFIVATLSDDFNEPLCLSEYIGLPQREERELADADVVSHLASSCLGEPDTGDLGITISA